MAIFTAIGLAIAGTATISLFGAAVSVASLIAGGLALATQLALSYLNRPKKRAYSAVQGQIQFGADVPTNAVFGMSKVKGQRVFYAKYGSGNKFNAEVFALANGWCDGLEPEIFFYGERHTLVSRPIIGNEAAHYGVDGFGSLVSIRFYDGRPGQGADTKLVADTANLGKTWKATSTGAGICYVVVERVWDEALFKHGRPEFEFVLRGLREYDPRFDDTSGGTGSQRLSDPSTWVWTENPAIHRLNYLLGVKGLVSGRTLIGAGKSIAAIDLASHIASANVCDTMMGDRKTYACSVYAEAADDHTELLREFEDSMAGYGMNRYGLSGVLAGAPQIAVMDIGPADLRAGEGRQVSYRKSAFNLINSLSGQFTCKASHWKPESLKTITVNADVSTDGRKREGGNDFLQVTDPDIAQYLLNIRYRQQRKGGSASIPVSRRVGLNAPLGSWVTFDGRTWLVTGHGFDAKLRFTLQLAETGADIYDDEDIQPGPIIIPPVAPTNPSLLSTVQNFNVEVGLRDGPDGYEIPTLRFTWTPPADPTITTVRFEYFAGVDPSGATIFRDQCDDPEAGEYETSKDIVPSIAHTARATIRTVPDRLKTWTPWKTTATATGAFQLYPPGLIQQIEDWTAEMLDWMDLDSPLYPLGQEVYELDDKVETIQADLADLTGAPDYDPLETYAEGDLVKYDGKLYRALGATTGNLPTDPAYWTKVGDYASLADTVIALTGRVDEAESEIEVTQGGFRSTTRDSRRIYNALMVDAVLEIDKAGTAVFDARDRLDASAVAARWTETEIGRVDGVLTVHASDITLVQATLGTKADLTVTQALQATIIEQGNSIMSQGGLIATIGNDLGALSATLTSDYYTKTQTDGVASSAASAATMTLSSTLAPQILAADGKGTTALGALGSYTGANAVANAVTSLNTSVSDINGDLAAASVRTDSLFAALGGSTSAVRVKYEAMAGPSGYARLGIVGRTTGFADRTASAFMDVPADPGLPTRWVFQSDQFGILDSAGNVNALFDGNTAYLNNARIGGLTAANIDVAALMASSVFADNLYIRDSVQLGPAVIESGAFAPNAIFNMGSGYISRVNPPSDYLPYDPGLGLDWQDWLSVTIASPKLLPITFFCGFDVYGTSDPSGGGRFPGLYIEIRALLNGNFVPGLYQGASVSGYSQAVNLNSTFMAMPAPSVESNTIKIQGRVRINTPAWNVAKLGNGTITLTAQCAKVS